MSKQPSIESPLFTIAEAAHYLRIAQSTLYLKMKEFEVVRIGGRRVFITRKSLDRHIALRTTKPTVAPGASRRRRPVVELERDAADD